MRIRRLDIENFRGIERASWRLPTEQTFFTLIGPGDSTKSTILTALERALTDRTTVTFQDTDFHGGDITRPIRIRVAIAELPDELLTLDAFGAFLAGIDVGGNWVHEPTEDHESCVIVELLVDADLEPIWQAFRPPADDGEDDGDPPSIRAKHRARITAFRIDERVDAHLRWSRMSALGKLTSRREDAKETLTAANRAARVAAAEAVTPALKELAKEVQSAFQQIGSSEFADLKPGLDVSLTNAQGNLALFDGDIPLMNFGLGTRRLAGAATQQLANGGASVLLVDEIEYGLEPHRLVHLLTYLRNKEAFSQVFVTTHSPTALQHLDPEDLVMVRCTGGATDVRSLGDPLSLRAVIKRSPEAFLSRRVVVNEGKTEYGMVLQLVDRWNTGTSDGFVSSAALGVVVIEGDGGAGSVKWATELLEVEYEVVLFVDSDDTNTNLLLPNIEAKGGVVVRWAGEVCTEEAVCSQLDADGLNALIQVAFEVHDDPDTAPTVFADQLIARGGPGKDVTAGVDPIDVTTWTNAGIDVEQARRIVSLTASKAKWFKQIHKGRRLGQFVLDTPALQTGPVAQVVEELREAIYARPPVVEDETPAGEEATAGATEAEEPSEAEGLPSA